MRDVCNVCACVVCMCVVCAICVRCECVCEYVCMRERRKEMEETCLLAESLSLRIICLTH